MVWGHMRHLHACDACDTCLVAGEGRDPGLLTTPCVQPKQSAPSRELPEACARAFSMHKRAVGRGGSGAKQVAAAVVRPAGYLKGLQQQLQGKQAHLKGNPAGPALPPT